MINIIEELVYGDYRRAAGMVLPSIDASAKGGQYQDPFYSRQIIKGKHRKVVMATIEGLLVLSSHRRGVNASEDHTSSPSIDVITALLFSIDHLDNNYASIYLITVTFCPHSL